MFKDGLNYRGQRLVNWDCFLQTAVADDEVTTEDVAGKFLTFNYPVVNDAGQPTGERISFSTTRPETMLGDNGRLRPSDRRALHASRRQERAHSPERPVDSDHRRRVARRQRPRHRMRKGHSPLTTLTTTLAAFATKLPLINILHPDGTLNENAGEWQSQDRTKARDGIVAKMEELATSRKWTTAMIPMKFSDRSKTRSSRTCRTSGS